MTKIAAFCLGTAMAALAAWPLAAQETAAPAAVPADMTTVLAEVNGTTITLGDMIVAYAAVGEQYKSMSDADLFQGLLEQLIQQVALEQTLSGKLTPKDDLVLKADRRNYLANVSLNPIAEAAVTEAALQAAYDAAVAALPPETEYRASHILVDSQEKAAKLLEEIQGGKAFADVAKENSTDGSAASGGDLGWFGLGMMVKPFEEAVVAATVGTVSGPVQTDFGWHLILVTETRAKAPPSLDEMRAQLSNQLQTDAIKAHLQALTDAAQITRSTEGIDPALMKDFSLLGE